MNEHVVLVNEQNEVIGTAPKAAVHTDHTPLHRAFSVFLFNGNGKLLLQQRSKHKKTWPLIWSNSCCGHPKLNESTIEAAQRRIGEELGLSQVELFEVIPHYRYRAELHGIMENEICLVLVGFTTEEPVPNPQEVENVRWISLHDFIAESKKNPDIFSIWSREESVLLVENDRFKKLCKKKNLWI